MIILKMNSIEHKFASIPYAISSIILLKKIAKSELDYQILTLDGDTHPKEQQIKTIVKGHFYNRVTLEDKNSLAINKDNLLELPESGVIMPFKSSNERFVALSFIQKARTVA